MIRTALIRHAVACAYAASPDSRRRRDALAQARSHLRALRGSLPILDAVRSTFGGLIAEAEGNVDTAVAKYRDAVPKLSNTDTHLFAHAVRYRLSGLVGGDEGDKLRAGVRTWLEAEGVRDPETMIHMVMPGPR